LFSSVLLTAGGRFLPAVIILATVCREFGPIGADQNLPMKIPASVKTVLSPFLTIAFLAISATGLLMFFRVHSGTIREIHEILGVLFVVAGLVHFIVNFRQLAAYLKLRRSWIAIAATLTLIAFAAVGDDEGAPQREQRMEQAGRQ
jgi:hypothetical protein